VRVNPTGDFDAMFDDAGDDDFIDAGRGLGGITAATTEIRTRVIPGGRYACMLRS
jgi:hypothetical protein